MEQLVSFATSEDTPLFGQQGQDPGGGSGRC